ncbi:MAG: hypothetical protein AAFP20_25735, partial [Cyanobacteria bacterium J06614_10]
NLRSLVGITGVVSHGHFCEVEVDGSERDFFFFFPFRLLLFVFSATADDFFFFLILSRFCIVLLRFLLLSS